MEGYYKWPTLHWELKRQLHKKIIRPYLINLRLIVKFCIVSDHEILHLLCHHDAI